MDLTKLYARIMEHKSLVELRMGQSIAESGIDLDNNDKKFLLDKITFAVDSGFNQMIENLIKNEDNLVTKTTKARTRKKN